MSVVSRLLVCLLLCPLGAGLVVLFGATPASAHARIVETWPTAGEVVPETPADVRLRFDEAVTLVSDSVLVLDFDGKPVATGRIAHVEGRANTAVVTLPTHLANGTYVVSWRVGSADSHIVAGAFRFSIGEPSAVVIDSGNRSPGKSVPIAQGIGRGIAFSGFALFVGGMTFALVVWPGASRHRVVNRLIVAGGVALVVGTVATLLLQGPAIRGKPLTAITDMSLIATTMSSRLGPALLVRLGIVAVLAAVCFAAVRRTPADRSPAQLATTALGAIALAGTWTWADHSRTGIQQTLAVPAATLHLLAMATWLGGLAVLVACVATAPRLDDEARRDLWSGIERFSALALAAWVVLVATGVYLSLRQIPAPAALLRTNFGLLLVAKVLLVVFIIALASRARSAVRRRQVAERSDLPRALRTGTGIELVAGAFVLAVTAVLVNTTPARTSYTPIVNTKVALPSEVAQHFKVAGGTARLRAVPARPGDNVFDIYLAADTGRLLRVQEVTARLDAVDKHVKALPVKISEAEPGHYVATDVAIPFRGRWVLRIDLRITDFDEAPLSIGFRVR